jgi:hypothetical protein
METTSDIISDAQLIKVHANANFGAKTPRQTLNGAVLSYAMGFSTGHTAMMILKEHGLLRAGRGYSRNLTVKGKKYARAMSIENFKEICALVGA